MKHAHNWDDINMDMFTDYLLVCGVIALLSGLLKKDGFFLSFIICFVLTPIFGGLRFLVCPVKDKAGFSLLPQEDDYYDL